MPIYLLECNDCSFQWDQFFNMKDKKTSACTKCGGSGRRIFTAPNVSIDAKINPYDIESLVKKTGNMKGNLGNMFDLASEASEKRGGENDPIRKKALKEYAKKRRGKKYPTKDKTIDVKFRT